MFWFSLSPVQGITKNLPIVENPTLQEYFQTDHRAIDVIKRDFYLDSVFPFTN